MTVTSSPRRRPCTVEPRASTMGSSCCPRRRLGGYSAIIEGSGKVGGGESGMRAGDCLLVAVTKKPGAKRHSMTAWLYGTQGWLIHVHAPTSSLVKGDGLSMSSMGTSVQGPNHVWDLNAGLVMHPSGRSCMDTWACRGCGAQGFSMQTWGGEPGTCTLLCGARDNHGKHAGGGGVIRYLR